MCVEYVKQHSYSPYVFKDRNFNLSSKYGNMELSQLVYADDHTTANGSTEGAQHSENLISTWLFWTKCMRAKPPKCRSLGLSRYDLKDRLLSPPTSTYSAFDPKLTISNIPIPFIGDNPFKFLGRKLFASLSETAQRRETIHLFEKYLSIIDAQFLNGGREGLVIQQLRGRFYGVAVFDLQNRSFPSHSVSSHCGPLSQKMVRD